MTTHATRPMTDEELLGITLAPPAPRLYEDWDWGTASREEVSREVNHLQLYRGRLKTPYPHRREGEAPDPFDASELAKVEGELALLAPAAAKYKIPMEDTHHDV